MFLITLFQPQEKAKLFLKTLWMFSNVFGGLRFALDPRRGEAFFKKAQCHISAQ